MSGAVEQCRNEFYIFCAVMTVLTIAFMLAIYTIPRTVDLVDRGGCKVERIHDAWSWPRSRHEGRTFCPVGAP